MDLDALARWQRGVVTRAQALEAGLSPGQVRWRLERRQWIRRHPGVYQTHTGAPDWLTRASAALLHYGTGAALMGTSAAYLWGIRDGAPPVITVAVPTDRVVARVVGTRVRRRRGLRAVTRRRLRVTTAVQTLLDLADEPGCAVGDAVGLWAQAAQRDVVTADSLREALARRRYHQHRAVLVLVLDDLDAGVQSRAELMFRRDVVAAHGLPMMACQVPVTSGPRSEVRDFEALEHGVVVEIDGRLWHAGAAFHSDRRRDRSAARTGRVTLRAGWVEVATEPCELAIDIGMTLASRGWDGHVRSCGPACRVLHSPSA